MNTIGAFEDEEALAGMEKYSMLTPVGRSTLDGCPADAFNPFTPALLR